jgi:uncharacterized small protein (DUF1192 family)
VDWKQLLFLFIVFFMATSHLVAMKFRELATMRKKTLFFFFCAHYFCEKMKKVAFDKSSVLTQIADEDYHQTAPPPLQRIRAVKSHSSGAVSQQPLESTNVSSLSFASSSTTSTTGDDVTCEERMPCHHGNDDDDDDDEISESLENINVGKMPKQKARASRSGGANIPMNPLNSIVWQPSTAMDSPRCAVPHASGRESAAVFNGSGEFVGGGILSIVRWVVLGNVDGVQRRQRDAERNDVKSDGDDDDAGDDDLELFDALVAGYREYVRAPALFAALRQAYRDAVASEDASGGGGSVSPSPTSPPSRSPSSSSALSLFGKGRKSKKSKLKAAKQAEAEAAALDCKTRVLAFLERWMLAANECDFQRSGGMSQELIEFVTELLGPMGANRWKLMLLKKDKRAVLGGSSVAAGARVTQMQASASYADVLVELRKLAPEALAESLTKLEWRRFEQVVPLEFVDSAWNKRDKARLAPNLTALAQWFNRVSFWVAHEVLAQPTPKLRARQIKYFVATARHLRAINNFNTLMEIVSGLNNSAVQRLRLSWQAIGSRTRSQFDALERLMSPSANFRNYRQALTVSAPPCFPYLAPILRDLTFSVDGNARFLASDDSGDDVANSINFERVMIVGRSIHSLLAYRRRSFDALVGDAARVPDRALHLLVHIEATISDDELHRLSNACEPASPKFAAIEDVDISDILGASASVVAEQPPQPQQQMQVVASSTSLPTFDDDGGDFDDDPALWDCERLYKWLGACTECAAADIDALRAAHIDGDGLLDLDADSIAELGIGQVEQLIGAIAHLCEQEARVHRRLALVMPSRSAPSAATASGSDDKLTKLRAVGGFAACVATCTVPPRVPVREWDAARVCDWVRHMECSDDDAECFASIDGAGLLELTDVGQLAALGVSRLGTRKRLARGIDVLRDRDLCGPWDVKPPSLWSLGDVQGWLHAEGLAECADEFRRNDIDGAMLDELHDNDLMLLGITELSHRRLLRHRIARANAPFASPRQLIVSRSASPSLVHRQRCNSLGSLSSGTAVAAVQSKHEPLSPVGATKSSRASSRHRRRASRTSPPVGKSLPPSSSSSSPSSDELSTTFACHYRTREERIDMAHPLSLFRLRKSIASSSRQFSFAGKRLRLFADSEHRDMIRTDADLATLVSNGGDESDAVHIYL